VTGEWQGLDVGSPFDYAQQGILYIARHLPAPGRDGIPEEALDEVGDLIDAAGGRTLVLCSSWRAVERMGDYLRVRLSTPVLVQRRGEPAATLVDAFAADPATSLVGTMSLWQGVDVPGDTCSLVVIDRIPFPRPDDPIVSARQESLGREGFREVSVPRAGLLLAQGAGRLIRDTGDRGMVAVLDPRLSTASYGKTLREAMPPLWLTEDREVALSALARLRESWEGEGA
jgi:ATP-dependent DNA helicase DinG